MPTLLYPSDMTDQEWSALAPLLPPAKTGGRPRSVDLRQILNGIFYLVRSGCAWRMLPREYPPHQTVYHYFRQWRHDGTGERIHAQLREQVRQHKGRAPTPSAAVLDSQSIKIAEQCGWRGYDGGKKVHGRKRHLLVDTEGLGAQSGRIPRSYHRPHRRRGAPRPGRSIRPTSGQDLGRL